MDIKLGLTTEIRTVKHRKMDRGLQSPQLFYTCPRVPGASAKGAVAETPDNHAIHWSSFMTQIVMRDNYIPPHCAHWCANAPWRRKR